MTRTFGKFLSRLCPLIENIRPSRVIRNHNQMIYLVNSKGLSRQQINLSSSEINYQMKPGTPLPQEPQTLFGKTPFFPQCCPQVTQEHVVLDQDRPNRRTRIYLTLNKNMPRNQLSTVPKPPEQTRHIEVKRVPIQENDFQEDKLSFLQQIRKYNPNPESQKFTTPETKARNLDDTRDMNSSGKSQENNLSSLIENLNNEIFSDMFVSSAVKGKIVLSGSLGSISEVKSDMEISCPSEAIGYTNRNSEDR